MQCENCGRTLSEDAKFCEDCGTPVVWENTAPNLIDPEIAKQQPTVQIGPGITQSKDGIFRWTHEVNMYKNPVLIFTIWKIFMLSALFPGLLVFFLQIGNGFVEAVLTFFHIFGLVAAIMTALILIAYYLVIAPINGGRYCVIFEMDKAGIKHIQMKKQFKKSQALSVLGILAGIMAGNPTVAGANLMAGAKQSTYSRFTLVRKITVERKHHTIKVNSSDMIHNQIYAADEDFSFILDYILQHCPKNIKVKGNQ